LLKTLFQNEPSEYKEIFIYEKLDANYKTVFYVLAVLTPASIFMLIMSTLIQDDQNITIANAILCTFSLVLFIAIYYLKARNHSHLKVVAFIIHLTYGVILFWGMHMVGYNPDEVIFVMDMVLAIFILAFLFVTKYQVLMIYYALSLVYLFAFTPYLIGAENDLPKIISPILLMASAFFISRMLFTQFVERFIMSEKLKEKQVGLTSELYETLEQLRNTEHSISNDLIRTLVKVLEYYDFYTRGHSVNVSEYGVKIAKVMGFSEEQLDEILVCGLVHDIGKILIPVDLLNKRTPLSVEEFNVIKKHSQYGYDMLMEAKYLKNIAKIVLHHHERWDGNGYPLGLGGDDIPIESQILMVADAWDAMTSDRIYKKARTFEVAKEEMINLKEKQFAPKVVDALLTVLKTEYNYE